MFSQLTCLVLINARPQICFVTWWCVVCRLPSVSWTSRAPSWPRPPRRRSVKTRSPHERLAAVAVAAGFWGCLVVAAVVAGFGVV